VAGSRPPPSAGKRSESGSAPTPSRCPERVEDELGESDYSPAGLGLGLGQKTTPTVEAHHLLFDGDSASGQVEVPAPKREELAESQPSEAGEEDDRAKSRGHRVRQFENELRANDRTLDGSLHPGASHPARVGLDETVGHRCREDRPQQPVGLRRAHGAGVARHLGVPATDGLGGDGTQLAARERGLDVSPQQNSVQFECLRRQRPTLHAAGVEPAVGVVGEQLGTGSGVDGDARQLVVGDLGGPGVGRLTGGERLGHYSTVDPGPDVVEGPGVIQALGPPISCLASFPSVREAFGHPPRIVDASGQAADAPDELGHGGEH